jgi:hypothetical protein
MSMCGAAAGVLAAALSFATPALADDYVGNTPPQVGRADIGVGFIAPQVAVSTQQRAPAGSLALTGADIAGLTMLGAIAVGTGAIVLRRSRPVQS